MSGIKENNYFLVKIRCWMSKMYVAAVVFGKHTPDLSNKLHTFKYVSPGTRYEPRDFILVH